MKKSLLVGAFLQCCLSLKEIDDHEGYQIVYKRHEVPNHQPPYQVVENRHIRKRRLDVWKPIAPTEKTDINPSTSTSQTVNSSTNKHYSEAEISPISSYASKRQHYTKLAPKLGTQIRPKYQHYPKHPDTLSPRSDTKLPPSTKSSYTPPKLTAKLPKKPVNLPGYPVRRVQENTSKLSKPLFLNNHLKDKIFFRPLPASFTYSKPALPVKKPLAYNLPDIKIKIDEDAPLEVDRNDDKEEYGDLLFHLDNYHKNDYYVPSKDTNKAKTQLKANDIGSEPSSVTLSLPPVFPKLHRQDVLNALEVMDETLKPLVQVADKVSNSFSIDATRRQTVEELLSPDRQDDDDVLDGIAEGVQFTVQQVMENPKPLIILTALLLSVITGSAIGNTLTTIKSATRNTDLERRVGDCPVGYQVVYIGGDGEVVTVGEILNVRVKRESQDKEGREIEGLDIIDPKRRGYAYGTSPINKNKAIAEKNQRKSQENLGKPGYYCKKVHFRANDVQRGKAGVGITVNNDNVHDAGGSGPAGQVSITVGGVSVTVGADGKSVVGARAKKDGGALRKKNKKNKNKAEDLDKENVEKDKKYKHENELTEVQSHDEGTEDEEGSILDEIKMVVFDSFRQIRSLLTG